MSNVDDREVRRFLEKLQSKQLRQRSLAAIRKGMQILAKKTTENFQRNRRGFVANRRVKVQTAKGEKEKIRRVAKVVTKRKEGLVKVHIMDDYRVKWFEMGTKKRYTKGYKVTGERRVGKRIYKQRRGRGRYTGRIKPEWFFKKAQRQTAAAVEQKIEREMKKELSALVGH